MEEGTGIVVGSASIGIMRMEPPKEEVAAAPPSPTPPAPKPAPEATAPATEPESQVAAEEAKPASAPETRAERRPHRPRVYTVRRGDTLWEIAEAFMAAAAIANRADNRRKIHNRWISGQKFHILQGDDRCGAGLAAARARP
jgi:nucleoid-associated protein YgaU